MLLAPRAGLTPNGCVIPDLFERPRRKNYCNEATVLDDFDAPKGSDVFKETAEIVLRVACSYTFCHLSILAKILQQANLNPDPPI